MIQVDAETVAALKREVVKASMVARVRTYDAAGRPGETWGEDFDVSDCVVDFPNTSTQAGPYLGTAKEARVAASFSNEDGLFTLGNSEGIFGNRDYVDRFGLLVSYFARVERDDGTSEDIPVYAGLVRQITQTDTGRVDLDLEGRWNFLEHVEVPEGIVLDRMEDTPSGRAKAMIESVLYTGAGDVFDGTWEQATTLYKDMDWTIAGVIQAASQIAAPLSYLARSGLAQIIPLEDGRLRWLSMWPEQEVWSYDQFPDVIDGSIGFGWSVVEAADATATRVEVIYQGVSVGASSSDATRAMGDLVRSVSCPFIAFGRCAKTAARMILERHGGSPVVVSWSMGPLGTLIQVGDRVTVKDPYSETERLVQVVRKSWTPSTVRFEAVAFNDEDTIVGGTFARWDSTTWGDSTALML